MTERMKRAPKYFVRIIAMTINSMPTTRYATMQRGVDVGDEEGEGVADAADEGHAAGDRATGDRVAAPGQHAIIRERLREAHADRRADRRREADEQRLV